MSTPKGLAITDTTGLANYFCKLRIGDVDIPTDAINSIVIRSWIFEIPSRLEMTLTDNGSLFELFPIEEGTLISLEIAKNKESNHIVSEFVVDNHSVDILFGGSSNIVTITAYNNHTKLFNPGYTRSFKSQSSVDVLKKLAGDIGWKTDVRVQSSDVMSWLQINASNYDQILHCLERSFIPSDLLLAYSTFDNKFVITSLKTELQKKDFKIMRYDLDKAAADIFYDDVDKATIFTNGYKFQDHSGYMNKKAGNGINGTYYNLKEKKDVLSVLDFHPLATHKSNQPYLGNIVDSINFGTLTNNMHKNYFKAIAQNRQLLGISFGSCITAKINPLAIGYVELCDVINFALPSINTKETNEIRGGSYLLTGLCYYASKGHPLQCEASMMRNGRNKGHIV